MRGNVGWGKKHCKSFSSFAKGSRQRGLFCCYFREVRW
uniref:Uncharacterized protein n=1 Tax=Siphoviridae sp. ctoRD1 TaxID=2825669 RepID=A0A8S5QG49_9CAUD|nr:MAG TPA: hypothetical protein [Siphoviridae sp. ctoRD1]